jgi:hypothetical protein
VHNVQTCSVNFQSGIKDLLSNMGMCSCVTDLSRQRKCCILLCWWAGIGGIVVLILNDENACVKVRQIMTLTGIGLSAFSIVTSGKNSDFFHTLGYEMEMGNLQKLVFFHTQNVLFHTLKNNFIP